jgi:hypothetical protein
MVLADSLDRNAKTYDRGGNSSGIGTATETILSGWPIFL